MKTYYVDFETIRIEANSEEEAMEQCVELYGSIPPIDTVEEIEEGG